MRWIQLKYGIKPFLYFPYTYLKQVVFGKDPYFKRWFWDKWGFLDERVREVIFESWCKKKPIIWIDAASGGELTQLHTFIRRLKEKNIIILSTNASQEAYEYAERELKADFLFHTPWDFAFVARKVLSKIHPQKFITIVFSRIPIHFKYAQQEGITTVLLSAFMRCNFPSHPNMERAFSLGYYKYFNHIYCQTQKDLEGFAALGVAGEKMKVLGDMRFDLESLRISRKDYENLCRDFQIKQEELEGK